MDDDKVILMSSLSESKSKDLVKNDIPEVSAPRVEPVARGSVRKNMPKRALEFLIGEPITDVRAWLIYDVLLPDFRAACLHAAEMIFGGYTTAGRRTGDSRTKYARPFTQELKKTQAQSRVYVDKKPLTARPEEVIFGSLAEAVDVKMTLFDRCNEYGKVSAGDFFELAGVTCDYTQYDVGWFDIDDDNTFVRRSASGGYFIQLPRPVPLK